MGKKEKSETDASETKKKKKDKSEASEGGKKKEKSEVSEGGKKKKKEKSEASEGGKKKEKSEVSEGGKKKKKEKSEASEGGKKKKKEKSEASEGGGESKKKKKKKEKSEGAGSEGGESKKKKKKGDKSEKKKKEKKAKEPKEIDKGDELIQDILKNEDKAAKAKKLEAEVEHLKSVLKKRVDVDIVNLPPAAKLQAENDYLEAQIRELTTKYERLEDKFDIIKRAHKNATEALNHAHTQAMDQEEMEFMRLQLENKRNELAEARNLIRELQKVGWSMLPPKVADESKKTEKELETVSKNVKAAEAECAQLKSDLDKTKEELEAIQVKYKESKENGKRLEEDLDRIISEITKTQQDIESKAEEAKEMEMALKAVKTEIESAGLAVGAEEPPPPEPEPEPEIDPEELARIEEKKRKKQEKRDKRNAEKNEAKAKYDALKDEVNKKEEELRQMKKDAKEMQRVAKEANMDKNAMKKLEIERASLQKEVNDVKKSYEKEMVLRKMYYNIIEDMLGKVKVFCRVREEKGKEGLNIIDEYSLKVLGAKPQEFQFDKVFGPKHSTEVLFKDVAYLYEQANEGFNTCCFVYGETGAGKTYTTIGSGSEGIMKLGCGKLGDMLKKNKKNQLQNRVFTYNIELYQDRIYDLNKNDSGNNIAIKRDFYGMVVISHVDYHECHTEDDVKKSLNNAVANRSAAHSKLGCKPNQSHFIHTVTIEVGNKFQHKYHKGKVTMIKLAGSEKLGGSGGMNSSLSALGDVIAALSTEKPFIPYKNDKLTMLMQDSLGGGAKTLMIACVSPGESHNPESINTLTYASRVKTIKNEAIKNTDSEEVYKLKNTIDRLIRGMKAETISIAN